MYQTRWSDSRRCLVLFGLGVIPVFLLSAFAYMTITGDATVGTSYDLDLPRRFAFLAISALAFQVVFLSIGLAILRYRLFDIDVIIRKTLVYTALTVLLALVYFGSIVLLQRLFGTLTGVEQSPLAIVISTLVIAALFTPLHRRIQDWIDRHFFRKNTTRSRCWPDSLSPPRDETDLDALTAELVRVVQETMQPAHISVWLKENSRK